MDGDQVRRFGALTAADVTNLDAATIALGGSIEALMERAGAQVARLAWRMCGYRPGNLHVVAGRGHNGGDGVVAARHLRGWGSRVHVSVLAARSALDPLLERQCRALEALGGTVAFVPEAGELAVPHGVDLTIDAVLGTGFRPPPRPGTSALLDSLRGPVLSVDIPSGMSCDDGVVTGTAVVATATCTFGGVKRGLWNSSTRAYTGALFLADIGVPDSAWQRCNLVRPTASANGALRVVPEPEPQTEARSERAAIT